MQFTQYELQTWEEMMSPQIGLTCELLPQVDSEVCTSAKIACIIRSHVLFLFI